MRLKFGKVAAAAIAAAGLLTVLAAPASASCTAGICIGGSSVSVSSWGWVYVDGDSGANDVTVTRTATNVYEVVDTTGVDPGAGCSYQNALDQTTVTCTNAWDNVVSVTGGAGDDSIIVSVPGGPTNVFLFGGINSNWTSTPADGNNTLTANVGGDVTLYGGGGRDTLRNNSATCSACFDYLNGGAGNDYVYGSQYRDEMMGAMSGGLDAYAGDDEYYASGGDDQIIDTMGADHAHGGSGNDEIDVKDSSGGDSVNCGVGTDVAKRDASDTWANCETVS